MSEIAGQSTVLSSAKTDCEAHLPGLQYLLTGESPQIASVLADNTTTLKQKQPGNASKCPSKNKRKQVQHLNGLLVPTEHHDQTLAMPSSKGGKGNTHSMLSNNCEPSNSGKVQHALPRVHKESANESNYLTNETDTGTSEAAVTSIDGGDQSSQQPAVQPFSNPVYKKISLTNGAINQMTKEQIKDKLIEFGLDSRGHKDVLKKRLKTYYKRQKLARAQVKRAPSVDKYCDYLCVVDFEATCEEYNPHGYKYEIIEFPIVLINVNKLEIESEFHAYCRPHIHRRLSEFCQTLTGISQEQVDSADPFTTVLEQAKDWMRQHSMGEPHKFAMCTDGPWDMARFMRGQCKISRVPVPQFAENWINIRKSFGNFYKVNRPTLALMLETLGMVFEGRPHCGMDDARNIAQIALKMLRDGAELRVNERLDRSHQPHLYIPVSRSESLRLASATVDETFDLDLDTMSINDSDDCRSADSDGEDDDDKEHNNAF